MNDQDSDNWETLSDIPEPLTWEKINQFYEKKYGHKPKDYEVTITKEGNEAMQKLLEIYNEKI